MVYLWHNNFTFKKEGKKYELSLHDFGWDWDGGQEELAGFLIRIYNSKARDDFKKKKKKEGLKYADIKKDVIKAVKKHNDGLYEITGDNAVWHFGETGDEEWEILEQEGYSNEDIDEILGYYFDYDFKDFLKTYHAKELKQELINLFSKANTFEELFDLFDREELNLTGAEAFSNYLTDKVYEAVAKWKKAKKKETEKRKSVKVRGHKRKIKR